MRTRESVLTGAGLTAGALLGLGAQAQAESFLVDRSDGASYISDCTTAANDCNLVGAVFRSNNAATDDQIRFASTISGSTIGLGGISITDEVDIYGNGAGATTITAGGTSRLFAVDTSTGTSVRFFDLTLTGGNAGAFNGGAILNFNSHLVLKNSVLTGNHAHDGGAISQGNYPFGSVQIDNSTITDNTASDDGGGIYDHSGIGATIRNSTISGNHAGSGPTAYGGGIEASSTFYVYDSTISGNSAGYGGGIYADNPSAQLDNSIVSGNTAFAPNGNFPPGPDVYGYAVSAFSLIENTVGTTLTDTGGNILGQDPQLGPLQNNGGTTPTHLPALTSPVIDTGLSNSSTDQRGSARPFDIPTVANAGGSDASDMGAVELQAPPGPPAQPGQPSQTGQRAAALNKCKKQHKKAVKKKKANGLTQSEKKKLNKKFKKCKKKANLLPV